MQLVLTEDQELLAKTAADFVAERSPVARVRALRDADDELGFSPMLWKQMAELGWVGIPFPEELATTRDWLRSRGNSIEGGTSEVQRNVIAKRVLGLPD